MLLSCLGDEELETQTGEKTCPLKGKNSCLPNSTTPLNHTAPSPTPGYENAGEQPPREPPNTREPRQQRSDLL